MRISSLVVVALFAGTTSVASAAVFTSSNDPLNLFHGSVNQANVPMAPGNTGVNSCVPTAIANSLTYLDSIGGFGSTYGGNVVPGTTTALGINLGTNFMATSSNTGTSFNNWIDGTKNYIESVVPNVTQYRAMSGTYSGTNGFVQAMPPTWQFMHGQLAASAAMTLAIVPAGNGIGHCISLLDFNFNDGNNDNIVQNGELTLGVVDPGNPAAITNVVATGVGFGAITIPFFNQTYYVWGAYALIPGPGAGVMFAFGLVAMGRRRR